MAMFCVIYPTMRISISILFILITFLSFGQNKKMSAINASIRRETDSIYDRLVNIRRDFHRAPELAGKEVRTQKAIKKYLADLGIKVLTDTYAHSVVGMINGDRPGKRIAWRAEMDALPCNFPDQVEFSSLIKGAQHGCGHDVHLAIALGIAEILIQNKESINGTVYFIFQPEEETFSGAKNIIEAELFSNLHLDEIYSLHVTDLPVGKIVVKPNEMFAYQKRIRIEFKNELSKEQAQELAHKIRSLLSRSQGDTKPSEIRRMNDPNMGIMNPKSIFKDYLIMDNNFSVYTKNDKLFLESYLYETDESKLQMIIPKIKRIISKEVYTDKLLSVSFIQENPTVINDKKLTKSAMKTLNGICGNNLTAPSYGQVPFFNDDFAFFQQKIPGVYFLLGGSNKEKGIIAMNHAPGFRVDEECIRIGVRSFSCLIINKLTNK
jgi:metal-dependent amidase/aminoacylase/carboxypeptidase family protein